MRLLTVTFALILLLSVRAGAQHAPNATLNVADLVEFADQPTKIQLLISEALALTKRNLGYTFGSDDPANGGMDCSGTIYHLLRSQGVKDVPRDSQSQYDWTRGSGSYREVAGKTADSPEFTDLRPGDLMFWSGTYNTGRPGGGVSHVMLYLGTEAKTRKRVMFGASDGRTYDGVQRYGVSVFDFKMPRPEQTADFLGYAPIPGLPRGTIITPGSTVKASPKREDDEPARPKTKKKSEGVVADSETPPPRTKRTEVAVTDSEPANLTTSKKSGKTKTKAQAPDTDSETPKPKTKTAAAKSAAEATESETPKPKSKTAAAESGTPKTGTKKKSTGAAAETEASKPDSEAVASDPEPAKSAASKKSGTAKAKSGTSNPDGETPKPKSKTQASQAGDEDEKPATPKPKSKAGVSKAKSESGKSESDSSTPKTKGGFHKPKEETEEADAQTPKPATPKPKTKPKSKRTE